MFAHLSARVLPQLIREGDSVLMAISGGPDSMAMAEILCRYINQSINPAERSIALAAVHINHGLRQEAGAEEELVRVFTQRLGLPLSVHRFDAKAYARSVRRPLQEAAREWRYTCFAEEMRKRGMTSLATAHHLNDQAETLVHRFLRGSGPAGLAGIWPDRLEKAWGSTSAAEPLRIIRPLLTVTKDEILAYCRERGIVYAQDLSNESTEYTRNRIRLQLIPQLEREYNPRLQQVLSHTAEVMRWDEAFFQAVTAEKWRLYGRGAQGKTAALVWTAWREPPAILSRLLRCAIAWVRGDPRGMEQKFIKKLMDGPRPPGWSQDLPGIRVTASADGLVFFNPAWLGTQTDPLAAAEPFLTSQEAGDSGQADARKDVQADARKDIQAAAICHSRHTDSNTDSDAEPLLPDLVLVPNTWQSVHASAEKGADPAWASAVKKIGLFREEMAHSILQREPAVQSIAEVWLDNATIEGRYGPIVYRRRRPGDKMFVAGVGHKRLKKIWQEKAIPAHRRDRVKVLAAGSLVLAIPGLHIVSQPAAAGGPAARWVLLQSQ